MCRSCCELVSASTVKRPHGLLKMQRVARDTMGTSVETYCCNACGTCCRRAEAIGLKVTHWQIVAPE
jgi:hypothetical protein